MDKLKEHACGDVDDFHERNKKRSGGKPDGGWCTQFDLVLFPLGCMISTSHPYGIFSLHSGISGIGECV